MKRIELFGKKESRGSFDDFYDSNKYSTPQEAYEANDYVECDFVKDDDGFIYIQALHVQNPDDKKLHKLNFQLCPAGVDVSDDKAAVDMALLFFKLKTQTNGE